MVLHFGIVTTDSDYHALIPREEMQTRLIEYVHSELARASLDIPVFDANTYHQPDDVPSNWILRVDCRVDLATRASEAGALQAIGAASVVLRRGESKHLSGEPFAFFVTEKAGSSLVPTVEAAARDALSRSVTQFVIKFNK